MTHVTCSSCQLRFSRASAAALRTCPFCGGSLATLSADGVVGFQLVEPVVSLPDLPAVRAAALRPPELPS